MIYWETLDATSKYSVLLMLVDILSPFGVPGLEAPTTVIFPKLPSLILPIALLIKYKN